MGGVTDALFGGGKSKSSNKAFGALSPLLTNNITGGNNAFSRMSALLGLGGDQEAAQEGFNNYLDSTGYQSMLKSGSDAIGSNMAARGAFRSGATGKALTKFGQDLGQQKFGDYLGQLANLSGMGLQSAGILAGAGGQSTSRQQPGIVNSLFG
tara:strand:- start:9810 stop:10268 length:459 start_codon:yes stop_codon:yes gene_type:complete